MSWTLHNISRHFTILKVKMPWKDFIRHWKIWSDHTAFTLKTSGIKAFICWNLPLENVWKNLLVSAYFVWASIWPHCTRTFETFKREISLKWWQFSELTQYVSDFKNRLLKACEAARTNLQSAQKNETLVWWKCQGKKPGDKDLLFCLFLENHCKPDITALTQ